MELDKILDRFTSQGVNVFAVTTNPQELAEQTVKEWELQNLQVGYGLTREDAARWGLFASKAIKDSEPDWFTEPGLFVIRPDGELYASIVQTMPFARPSGAQLLKTLEWVIENDYPARGELGL